jgi:hypothetical protein
MACHIVLLSKHVDPSSPRDYRPLSLGDVVYQLIAKLITNMIQPYIDEIISLTQTTFIRGQNITYNTILMWEIIHSFQ